jgi:hypothetical protein
MNAETQTVGYRSRSVSLFALGTAVLRKRWLILGLGAVGLAIAARGGLVKPKLFPSTAVFIPQASTAPGSALAAAASQFGVSIPAAGGAWGPQMYMELLGSREFLQPLLFDTLVVPELGNKRATIMELEGIGGRSEEERIANGVGALTQMVTASEERRVGGVRFIVRTEWPSVSLALARLILDRINQYNIEVRRSQAIAEREFIEREQKKTEIDLRAAEDRLAAFLRGNRDVGSSPSLSFERDRLQRDVARYNQLYTTWLASQEDARIREVRDTPVITVFEPPRLPLLSESRRIVQRAILGFIAGAIFGIVLVVAIDLLRDARTSGQSDADEFFGAVDQITPAWFRRRAPRVS